MSEPRISSNEKNLVAERAGHSCEYCRSQAKFSPDPFSIEHIIPRSRGGSDHLDNLAFACQGRNNRKYIDVDAIDPISGERVLLFHPRQQEWHEHFAWNEDFSLMIGLTPVGRATVDKLKLNREGVVNLRRLLFKIGAHPPQNFVK